tara:strand:+ start:82323 stop:85388 length:3066 start_codon:yes stop_codon:yes gene_type:complete
MKSIRQFFVAMVLAMATTIGWGQQVQIVNMIPNAQSNETNQDSEPHLTINPATPNQLVGSAFTPNPLGATTPPSAPIYFSQDGGQTWVLNSIVPSGSTITGTGDITVAFGTTTNRLFSGILRSPAASGATRTMDILRTNNVAGTALMQQLSTRNAPDQPYVHARTVTSGTAIGDEHVYVGNNDLGLANQTATSDQFLNGGVTTPTLSTIVLEQRTTGGADMPPVRPASHSNGTVYIGFERTTTLTNLGGGIFTIVSDIIVVRDDNWGNGPSSYTDLVDPSDGLAGRIVVSGITYTFNGNSVMGQERIGSRLAIAVDPNNSNIVYLAWADDTAGAANTINLHLRRTTDGGLNWSTTDIRTVNNAINPQIAINNLGSVAFSYQQLTGGNWISTLERTTNNFVNTATTILNSFPDGTPASTFLPYLGDYTYLTAMPSGKDFVGIFSASNDPTPARFPTVQPTYQRNVNSSTNQLRNLANTANVNISIDPFFYRLSPVAIDDDFYVRDWTKTVTDKDPGDEPSMERVFYLTSDIWNRRSDIPGVFNGNDQPDNQNPRPVTAGNNFVYARVHRKVAGGAKNVNMLFLKSEFGTGSNYELINGVSSFASLAFSATDVQQTMTSGVEWNLIDPSAVTANHVCIAVEIATPQDPSANPTLLGRAPGWSNGTDLLVMADNNKAQRNLQVFTGTPSGEAVSFYAVGHNAALFERDLHIYLTPNVNSNRLKYNINFISGGETQNEIKDNIMILRNMKPCENRWIELTVATIPQVDEKSVSYLFDERINEMSLNGFAIEVAGGNLSTSGEDSLGEHAFVFQWLAADHGIVDGKEQAENALKLIANGVTDIAYINFLKNEGNKSANMIKNFMNTQSSDPFSVQAAVSRLQNLINNSKWEQAANAHGNLMRKTGAYLSFLDKSKGNTADILQTIRWMHDAIRRGKTFKQSSLADKSIEQAFKFITLYGQQEVSNKDYSFFVNDNISLWQALVKEHFPNQNFKDYFDRMKDNIPNPKWLQKSHCEFVEELVKHVQF